MVTIKQLANDLQTKLNNAARTYGYSFVVIAGTGKFKNGSRTVDNTVIRPINCRLAVISAGTNNTSTGIKYSTMTCSFSVAIPLTNTEEDTTVEMQSYDENNNETTESQVIIGNETHIANVRSILDSVMAENSAFAISNFTVSAVYQPMQDGEREILQKAGKAYVMTTYIYYVVVENGLNARNFTFSFDGVTLPFEGVNIQRSETADSYVFGDSTDGTSEGVSWESVLAVTFELPAFSSDLTRSLFKHLFGDEPLNTAHIVILNLTVSSKPFLMKISEIRLSGALNANAGITLTLVPAPKDFNQVNVSENLKLYDLTAANSSLSVGATETYPVYDFGDKTFHTSTFIPSHGTDSAFIIRATTIPNFSNYLVSGR